MILLDTCAIVWDALAPEALSSAALDAIENADTRGSILVSDISLWEVAMLIHKRRLQVPETATTLLNLFLGARTVSVKPISPEIAELSVRFGEDMNNDPADRLIAATAIVHNAKLVTADQNLIRHPMIETVW